MKTTPHALALLATLALILPVAAPRAAGVKQPDLPLLAGPMLGHVTESEAWVWVRTHRGSELTGTARQHGKNFSPSRVRDLGDDCHIVEFAGLSAGTDTEIEIVATGRGRRAAEKLATRTAPAVSDTGVVRIAFGSCVKVSSYPEVPVWRRIAEEKPDLMIHVGDNIYQILGDGGERHFSTTGHNGDWTIPDRIMARHMETRMNEDLQPLLRSVPSYAVWDDHDYGHNNADSGFIYKDYALDHFRQVWANPGWGVPGTQGIFSSFRRGPVEVFLLDDRYHKWVSTDEHKDVPEDERTIWGEGQLQWLMASLRASRAPVKVIANGTQFICASGRGEGHMQEAPHEQKRLLDFLAEHRIGGVVFLSGDRHHSEAMQMKSEGRAMIVECTSSPIQQGDAKIGEGDARNRHPNQLWMFRGNSYGLVTIEVRPGGEGSVRFEARDSDNQVPLLNAARCATTWDLRDLNY